MIIHPVLLAWSGGAGGIWDGEGEGRVATGDGRWATGEEQLVESCFADGPTPEGPEMAMRRRSVVVAEEGWWRRRRSEKENRKKKENGEEYQ
jgi:hypothetical protein